ncbi:hypothetical protein DGG96_13080 [Legionella qingyii]|uniref:Uncharacterized protein n=1 Tax=Legionella qingyii TaxID=2184757 RepID=A0A317U423_9GAMM|nr:hypothetical protein [Legionella qingyii]PWY55110.1 hypothetical protein DGG96_13080 [Legionella qingyii]RUR25466.1 hypothetical protein ELY20_03130 [Legionella qingyii]RUR28424.1 hypothetical protein ELY16_02880 [Legionella qingyii]
MTRLFKISKTIGTRKVTPIFKISLSQAIPSASKNTLTSLHAIKKSEVTTPSLAQTSNSFFFTKLKAEEHKQFTSKKRHRFEYEDNYSAALKLPYSNHQLATKHHDQNALLAMSKEHIIEHANRRVDLFFYTLIAYYKTGILPIFGHTTLQHGKGRTTRKNITISEACHSSFTPSLLDRTIYQNNKNGEKHKSLLSDTHLMENLNSTVELPPFVNDLDDLLEYACREQCLTILRDVSLAAINPIEGLTEFLHMMNKVLNNLKQDAENKNQSALLQHSLMKHKPINPNLIELVITGTLSTTYSEQTNTATDAYIQLLLRMTPEEKAACQDAGNKEKIYIKKTMELQNEILQTKHNKHPSPQ